jgi:hypothetical protein
VAASPTAGWPPQYVAGPFAGLGHSFDVLTSDTALHDYIASAFAGLTTTGPVAHHYEIRQLPSTEGTIHELHRDGAPVHRTLLPETTVGALSWSVNQAAVRSRPDLVIVHAAVATWGGSALLLPAAMEAGKTTLVAGLVLRGLGYLSDELAAIDPATLLVQPYPKPLTLERGSWPVLPALAPDVAQSVRPYTERQWQVGVQTIRPNAVADPARARWIVAPRYERGAATRLEPMGRSEMLKTLTEQCFRLDAAGFRTLASVVGDSSCHRLVSGSLPRACEALLGLIDA